MLLNGLIGLSMLWELIQKAILSLHADESKGKNLKLEMKSVLKQNSNFVHSNASFQRLMALFF